MGTFWQDIRYAFRMLARNPRFMAVVVLTMALGIGATTGIFSVVNAVLLRPLPLKNIERLAMIWETDREKPDGLKAVPLLRFLDWQSQCTTFESVAFFRRDWEVTLVGVDEAVQLAGNQVSPEFFSVLGVNPVLGRPFSPEEAREDGPPVIILSHAIWQRLYEADPQALGSTVTLEDVIGRRKQYTVIGVMPAGFRLFNAPHFLLPYAMDMDKPGKKGTHSDLMIGKLKPGITRAQAQAELETIAGRNEPSHPTDDRDRGVRVTSLHEELIQNVRFLLFVFQGTALLVLLVAGSNMANLLLARSASRGREMAVRLSLGAGRRRILRQLLTESLLLAIVGGAFGLLMAHWGVDGLGKLAATFLPRVEEINIDGRVLAVTCLLSVASGLIFGLAPAIRASKADLNECLKEGGAVRGLAASRPSRTRHLLVIAEVASSLVLLVGAGLLLKSFILLNNVRLGFSPENVLVVDLGGPIFPPPSGELLERLSSLPGVQAVGAVTHLPPDRAGRTDEVTIEGDSVERKVCYQAMTPHYFRAMGISVVKGRGTTEQDAAMSAPVVIVNETFVEQFLDGVDPIGKTVANDATLHKQHTIMGVVRDVPNRTLRNEIRPAVYYSSDQEMFWAKHLVLRTASKPMALATSVREVIRSVETNRPILSMRTMKERIGNSILPEQFQTILVTLFSAVGLALATVGVYGIVSYSAAQRVREFGIRIALGAQRANILRLVVRQALWLMMIGLGLGLAGAVALTRVLRTFLFKVEPLDTSTFAIVSLFLACVVLVASYVPARRATKIDPMTALRYE